MALPLGVTRLGWQGPGGCLADPQSKPALLSVVESSHGRGVCPRTTLYGPVVLLAGGATRGAEPRAAAVRGGAAGPGDLRRLWPGGPGSCAASMRPGLRVGWGTERWSGPEPGAAGRADSARAGGLPGPGWAAAAAAGVRAFMRWHPAGQDGGAGGGGVDTTPIDRFPSTTPGSAVDVRRSKGPVCRSKYAEWRQQGNDAGTDLYALRAWLSFAAFQASNERLIQLDFLSFPSVAWIHSSRSHGQSDVLPNG
jgi:hypothetical protein